MSRWLLYWVMKCDDLKKVCDVWAGIAATCWVVSAVLWFIGGLVSAYAYDVHNIPWPQWCEQALRITVAVLISTSVLYLVFGAARHMLPSTKEMAVLLVVPPITNAAMNNEALRRIPKRLADLANEWLEMLAPAKSAQDQRNTATAHNKPMRKRSTKKRKRTASA